MARPRTVSDEHLRDAAREAFHAHGAAVSVATIAARLGISAPAVLKRVGTKEQLLLLALCSSEPPPFFARLRAGPSDRPHAELVALLVEAAAAFRQVAPTLAVLRTSGIDPGRMFPAGQPSPNVEARLALAAWLRAALATDERRSRALAELLLGAIESRAFLSWIEVDPPNPEDPETWITGLIDAACPTLEGR